MQDGGPAVSVSLHPGLRVAPLSAIIQHIRNGKAINPPFGLGQKEEEAMAVKVLINRKVTTESVAGVLGLIIQLRASAASQPGYISGETLMSVSNPDRYLVISTWQTIDDWNAWFDSNERKEIQKKIDELLGEVTEYEIYHYPEMNAATLRSFRGWEGG